MRRGCLFPYACLLAVTPALCPAARADSAEARFAEAQRIFDAAREELETTGEVSLEARRRFHEAARAFAALAGQGVESVNLYVNAGNACHFAGDDARALLWYMRATRLANTPEARAGLATLRRVCKAELWPAERTSIGRLLLFWHHDVSRWNKQVILLVCYPLGCGLIVVRLLLGRRGAWLKLGVALMIVGGTMGVSDVIARALPGPPWAVVLTSTSGRAGDGQGYSVVVEAIKPGQEVRLVERRPQWVRIELPSRTRCWVPAEVCEQV